MNSPWAALLEMLLVFGIVIGAAVWGLVSLRREQARDRERADANETASARPRTEADQRPDKH